jgi:hypothetical protein
MRLKPIVTLAGCVCIPMFAASLPAHHGYAAYDMTKTVSVKGTVTSYRMANPHGSIALDVQDEHGSTVHWILETGATVHLMKEQGFKQDTLKPGDSVTVIFNPAKDPSRHSGVFKQVELADGEVFPKTSSVGANVSASPAP